MLNVNCEACEEIRETDPSLIVNGWSDSECASMKNDTGLVASSGHDDCEDLTDMNDCLIGNEDAELEKYDTCDWKKFMHRFIPNLWTLESAIICAICGIWTNIHALWEEIRKIWEEIATIKERLDALESEVARIWNKIGDILSDLTNVWNNITNLNNRNDELCRLLDQVISPSIPGYGSLPLATSSANRCGTVTSNVYQMPDDGTLNPYTKAGQNMGIFYAQLVRESCSGSGSEMLEWIAPDIYLYKLESGVQNGDILWKITKSEAQSKMGMSDFLWNVFTRSSWTWHTTVLYESKQSAWLKICVGDEGLASNEMGIIFKGCGAPNEAITSRQEMSNLGAEQCRVYRHAV